MKKVIFDKGYALLVISFPEKQMDKNIMWDFLQDLTDEQFITALNRIITTQKDINRATNIIALIREEGLSKNRELAAEAWTIVMKAVSKIGSYGIPEFKNPIIKKAVDCIGWRNICLSETPMVERAHFLKIYDQLCVREKTNDITKITHRPIFDLIHQTAKAMK